jgi:glycerol-3-phosphate O-acyltransferase
MMGEAKIKESLSRLLKAADVLKENFGRIYLELC